MGARQSPAARPTWYANSENPLQAFLKVFGSVADPDRGSGIGCLFDPWIRDRGWEKVSIRIRDPG